MNALGIYIFAGGFTVGVKEHFNVLAHLENGNFGVKTAKANFPDLPIYTEENDWPVHDFTGVDFIYGNPPCAAFSTAGSVLGVSGKHKGATDPRLAYHRNFMRVALELQPKIFTLESVSSILSNGRAFLDELTQQAIDNDYSVTLFLTDATNHGLAQRRRRLFFIAHQVRLDFEPLTPQWITVNEVLRMVKPDQDPHLATEIKALFPRVPPGGKVKRVFQEVYGNDNNYVKPSFMLSRLRGDRPGGTIATHADYLHPIEDRLLAPSEAAALCGYPLDYIWTGGCGTTLKEIGSAVLPATAEYVASMVHDALLLDEPIKSPTIRTVDFLTAAEKYYKDMCKKIQ